MDKPDRNRFDIVYLPAPFSVPKANGFLQCHSNTRNVGQKQENHLPTKFGGQYAEKCWQKLGGNHFKGTVGKLISKLAARTRQTQKTKAASQ